ncbi:GmrSD restriction endonuclease domain-containing protein [Brevibacterium renqingii]|uniref:GmrSD restriction endonuclease domain-containing protein n=1 Tax=Brevibacterium renqingii TaxID=2776916 RepID=UPI001AE0BEA7|nr:DUF1524 domain-containing protein [Brevibacterium renqingii]
MHFSSPSDLASTRLSARVLLALVSLLTIALLAGCAEGSDANAGGDDVSWSTEEDPTPQETQGSGPAEDAEAAVDEGEDGTGTEDSEDVGRAGGSATGTAMAMLDELAVKGRAPKTGYDADLFKWRSDADHNGCDTRNDVLRRDLTDITLKAGTKGCVVIAGALDDEYKGESYAFDRSPNNIDIDHIVARSNAWQTGAAKFDEETLREFGNDPLNLLAVSSSLNRQKGDADAATWLPPHKAYRCEYVARQIAIKHKYELWVVKAEKSAMERVLSSCDEQPAFADDVSWPGPGDGDNVTTEQETKKPAESKSERSSGSTYFKNCTAAREAGAAPVREGDPGYGRHLDRDGDGIGCE